MGVFLPKSSRNLHKTTLYSCWWCGVRKQKKDLYKLRDGPLDWYFCDDNHALKWVDHRHLTPGINAMLKCIPLRRDLNGKTIDDWVRDELSQSRVIDNALSESRGGFDGLCNVDNNKVPV
jgi:hypothetical protein